MEQDYKQYIIRVFDPVTDEHLDINNISVMLVANKYSNTRITVWRIFNNGVPITRNNKYKA